ncbi:MAG TPA: NrsF family protein, partial [Dongiaceae bacterium]|nr:NrsF family protein [Dongiaceae bacterium]
VKDAVLAMAAAPPSMDRKSTRRAHRAILLLGPLLLAVLLVMLGGFTPGDRPISFVIGTTSGWIAVAIACGWLATGRGGGKSMLGPPTHVLIGTVLVAPLALFGWLMLWNIVYHQASCAADISAWGKSCHSLIVAMSAVMFSAFAAIRRFGDPVHPKSSGAVMGVAAATAAGSVINLRCTCTTMLHVGVGHVLPLLVSSLLGALLGSLLLRLVKRPRRESPKT